MTEGRPKAFVRMPLHPSPSRPVRLPRGFTLVEIMIVMVIIGLLAALAIPAVRRVHTQARVNAFLNDLRIGRDGFETYALAHGTWPPDGGSGVPAEIDGYISSTKFNGPTPLGGNWDWDYQQFGVTAGLSVLNPRADLATMRIVDENVDDGNLMTGNFRIRPRGYIYILEP